eukprot:Opistho-1_new@6355
MNDRRKVGDRPHAHEAAVKHDGALGRSEVQNVVQRLGATEAKLGTHAALGIIHVPRDDDDGARLPTELGRADKLGRRGVHRHSGLRHAALPARIARREHVELIAVPAVQREARQRQVIESRRNRAIRNEHRLVRADNRAVVERPREHIIVRLEPGVGVRKALHAEHERVEARDEDARDARGTDGHDAALQGVLVHHDDAVRIRARVHVDVVRRDDRDKVAAQEALGRARVGRQRVRCARVEEHGRQRHHVFLTGRVANRPRVPADAALEIAEDARPLRRQDHRVLVRRVGRAVAVDDRAIHFGGCFVDEDATGAHDRLQAHAVEGRERRVHVRTVRHRERLEGDGRAELRNVDERLHLLAAHHGANGPRVVVD